MSEYISTSLLLLPPLPQEMVLVQRVQNYELTRETSGLSGHILVSLVMLLKEERGQKASVPLH